MDKRLVRVEWTDAQDHIEPWVSEKDTEDFAEQICIVLSVGFLVRKTDKYVTIAADWNESNKDYGRVTKIPVGMVQKLEDI